MALLDDITATPVLAYGLRKLSDSYAGDCIRVSKQSNTATQTDIGFDGDDLDVAAATGFDPSLYVETKYDQSGNGNDLEYDEGARAVLRLSSPLFNDLPEMNFGDSSPLATAYRSASDVTVNKPKVFMVLRATDTTTLNIVFSFNINSFQLRRASNLRVFLSDFVDYSGNFTPGANQVSMLFQGDPYESDRLYANGVEFPNIGRMDCGAGPITGKFTLGNQGDTSSSAFLGGVVECLVFDGNISAADVAIIEQNQREYWLERLTLADASPHDGTNGRFYRRSFTVTGGVEPYTSSIQIGTVPDGLEADEADIAGVLAIDKPSQILCIGDSITYGRGAYNRTTDSPPSLIRAELPSSYSVVNLGVSGRTTVEYDAAYAAEVRPLLNGHYEHQIAFNRLGVNDIINTAANLPGLKVAYQSLVDKEKADDLYVIVSKLMPYYYSGNQAIEDARVEFNRWLEEDLVGADAIVDPEDDPDLTDFNDTTYFSDQVHNTTAGAVKYVAVAMPKINEALALAPVGDGAVDVDYPVRMRIVDDDGKFGTKDVTITVTFDTDTASTKVSVDALTIYGIGEDVPTTARVFTNKSFIGLSGEEFVKGDVYEGVDFIASVPVTVGDAENSYIVGAFEDEDALEPTVSSDGKNKARLTLAIYDSGGNYIKTLQRRIKVAQSPTSTTWRALAIASNQKVVS